MLSRSLGQRACAARVTVLGFQVGVVLKPFVSLIGRPVAHTISVDQTHRHTNQVSTIILTAHACRRLMNNNNIVGHYKPCQELRLQPQPVATDVQPQHDLWERLTVEQCLLPASGGDTETSGAAVNELSQKWDYTFTSREPHILSPGVDIDRSGEESLNCLHISSLSSIVELCSSLGREDTEWWMEKDEINII